MSKSDLDFIYNFGVIKTNLDKSTLLSNISNANVFIKREDLQLNRSFKCRGAINAFMQNIKRSQDKDLKFVCASAGNHSQGFSMACAVFEKYGTIFMPKNAIQEKINRTKELGTKNGIEYVKIIQEGDNLDEALVFAKDFTKNTGAILIHPYDDHDIISGQRSLFYELSEQLPSIDYIFIGVGGGGLVSGIIKAITEKNLNNIKIVTCQSDVCGPLMDSLKLKKNLKHEIADRERIADGAMIKKIGDENWEIIKNYQNLTAINITNDEILYSIGLINKEFGNCIEGAGALSVAGLLKYSKTHNLNGENIIAINSGGNISEKFLKMGIETYLKANN